MDKEKVAALLDDIAVLLEFTDESPFKARAYAAAAHALAGYEGNFEAAVKTGGLEAIKGIGRGLAEKITELAQTGHLSYYEELKAKIPAGFFELLRVPGLGPKKIKILYRELGVASLGALEYACHENRLLELPGFGKKTQDKILTGIAFIKKHQGKHLLTAALPEARAIKDALEKLPATIRVSLAGSVRRHKEVIKDLDLVLSSSQPADVMDAFIRLPQVEAVVAHGETKSSVTLKSGINADLRVVGDEEFPYALHHFTGSKEHNVAMRGRALKLGFKMNEYGLFREEKNVPCRDEVEIFAALKLAYIPPELREDMGEIAAAERGELPELLTEADLHGALHLHTSASDGALTLAELAGEVKKRGYEYMAICDHSRSAAYAGGLKEDALRRQHEEIDKLSRSAGLHIFKGIESDILPDGELDYPEEILKTLDLVVASVHSHFNMPEAEMTRRIVKALENPYTTILGHPTGRLLLSRDAYPVDMRQIIDAAAANGVALELNAHPYRLDLDWRWGKAVKEKGVKVAINPDAHHAADLDYISFGVGIARKGWLEKSDILNALSLSDFRVYLKKRKK